MRDTLERQKAEPEEGPARFNRRRMVRWIAVLTIGIVLVLQKSTGQRHQSWTAIPD